MPHRSILPVVRTPEVMGDPGRHGPGLPEGLRAALPASPSALAGAGLKLEPGFQNSTALVDPQLAFLGDVFCLPVSWPLSNVFSVGDILIALGIVWALHRICRSRLAPSRQHS